MLLACSDDESGNAAAGGGSKPPPPDLGARGCYPGETEACSCPAGFKSVRECLPDGGRGACECTPLGPDAGEWLGGDKSIPGVKVLKIAAFDVEADPVRDVLYTTIGNPAPEHQDSLVALNPSDGAVLWKTALSAKPHAIGVSDDGTVAYVGVREPSTLVRVDLATHAETARYPMGNYAGAPEYAFDIDVIPGNPNRLIVVKSGDTSYSTRGEATLLENGTPLGMPTPYYVSADEVIVQSATTAYGVDTTSTGARMVTFAVSVTGLSVTKTTDSAVDDFSRRYSFDGQWIFNDAVQAIDPASHAQVGLYPVRGIAVADRARDRVYVAVLDQLTSFQIVAFDRDGFTEVGRLALPGIGVNPLRMALTKGGTLALVIDSAGDRLEVDNWLVLISPSVLP